MISFDKLKTKVAAFRSSTQNFNHQHMTTLDFGLLRPVLTQELVPNDSLRLRSSVFSRLAPLALPTIGQCDIEQRAFFVRSRTLCESFTDVISGHANFVNNTGQIFAPRLPYCTMKHLCDIFVATYRTSIELRQMGVPQFITNLRPIPSTANPAKISESTGAFDISFYDVHAQYQGANDTNWIVADFTSAGKAVYSLLLSLGYALDFRCLIPANVGTDWRGEDLDDDMVSECVALAGQTFSMLPLLAYLKIYWDYYANPRYSRDVVDSLFLGNGTEFLTMSGAYTNATVVTTDLGVPRSLAGFLVQLSRSLYSLVSPDIFNSSWLSPMDNTANLNNSDSAQRTPFDNVARYPDALGGEDNTLAADSSSVYVTVDAGTITNFAISGLKALTSFMRRNNVVGTRYVDRLLARFGVRPSDVVAGRAEYLGSMVTSVNIGDVTATGAGSYTDGTNTFTSNVGDYSGKGVAFGNGNGIKFDTDEHGFLIVLATVRPRTQYEPSYDYSVRRLGMYDFYIPEYDSLGMAAIPMSEVCGRITNGAAASDYYGFGYGFDEPFGFLPTYYDYKYKRDQLSGDFACPRDRDSISSFHLFRSVDPTVTRAMLSNDLTFQEINNFMRAQYDRIFRDSSTDYEHFYCSFVFDLSMKRPMMSLEDSLLDVDEKGHEVTTPVSGQRF